MRLIDADKLDYNHEIYDYETGCFTQAITTNEIDYMPTIDIVKHANWDLNPDYWCSMGLSGWMFKCSNCEQTSSISYNYCPNCGCLMNKKVY